MQRILAAAMAAERQRGAKRPALLDDDDDDDANDAGPPPAKIPRVASPVAPAQAVPSRMQAILAAAARRYTPPKPEPPVPPLPRPPAPAPSRVRMLATPPVQRTAPGAEEKFTVEDMSPEQRDVFECATNRDGPSIYIGGGAGVGKTKLLKAIIAHLKGPSLHVTATTGTAAVNLGSEAGATTVHRFAGIGLGKGDKVALLAFVLRNPKAVKNLKYVRTVIIDEISMLDGDLLDKIEYVVRNVRLLADEPGPIDARVQRAIEHPSGDGSNAVFGGVRVILCGDFLQLPPVPDKQYGSDGSVTQATPKFAFDSVVWNQLQLRMFRLTVTFRQHGDVAYAQLLAKVRMGECPPDVQVHLEARVNTTPPPGAIVSCLLSRNEEVDAYNREKLRRLKGQSVVLDASDESYVSWMQGERLDKALDPVLPARIELRVGAQVILLRNLSTETGLFNGAQGRVVALVDLRNKDVREKYCNDDAPLAVQVAVDNALAWGHPIAAVVAFESRGKYAPPSLITAVRADIKEKDKALAARIQVPLRLSWAITMHRAQGQTITSYCIMDLSKEAIFAPGQAYVALSRLPTIDKLLLKAFDPRCIWADARAIVFEKRLIATCKYRTAQVGKAEATTPASPIKCIGSFA